MRICFLAGANSTHSERWIEYLAKRGHEVHWITLTPNSFGEIINAKIYFLKSFFIKPLTVFLNIIPVRKLINKINPDVLHVHYAGVNGILGLLSGFHPLVLTVWGSDILITAKSKILKPVIKQVLKKADFITCGGDTTMREAMKLGAKPQKIKIVHRYIDLERFRGSQKKTSQDSLTIISTRWLAPLYDIESLIRAIPLILKKFSKVNFIIIGDGPQEDYLKKIVKSMGIESYVRFLGRIPHNELPSYLASSDVYVNTTLSDGGIAASVLEAMASCLPCVVTDVNDYKEWIKNGVNGFIVPPKDPKALAEKIIYLLENKSLREEMGENNRKLVMEMQKHGNDIEIISNLYKELIK